MKDIMYFIINQLFKYSESMRLKSKRVYMNNANIGGIPRPSIKFLKEYFKNTSLIGCEIGVKKGINAKSILDNLNIKTLFLIDIWNIKHIYSIIIKKFACNSKVIIKKGLSSLKCNDFKNNSLDFIYIDADHRYKNCLNDITIWYNKVKFNGVICGHDIINGHGVLKALNHYCKINNIFYRIVPPDFYFIKRGITE